MDSLQIDGLLEYMNQVFARLVTDTCLLECALFRTEITFKIVDSDL